MVEEAAEIQESHVLTSLGAHTKHLIMVGDHKQLRPKCESYELTVESGSGHTLNISMFERLVLGGFPHPSLAVQHRMRLEISQLIRPTYPLLEDHGSVLLHPAVLGLTKNVVFIDHRHHEGISRFASKQMLDSESIHSKVNLLEVQMVVAVVRYLFQQGYKSKQMVVLTPYMAQLNLIKQALSKEYEVEVGELDMEGLQTETDGEAVVSAPRQQRVRVATIDNYQGGNWNLSGRRRV